LTLKKGLFSDIGVPRSEFQLLVKTTVFSND